MLENEPNDTQAADTAASAPEQPAKRAAAKKTVRKRPVKKTAAKAAEAPVPDAADQPVETAVSTQSDAAAADPAPAPAKRQPAKKAVAKRTVKKAAAKRPAKKAATSQDAFPELTDESAPEAAVQVPAAEAETQAPAKKTTRKRTPRKSAAARQADLLAEEAAVTDGPVADAEEDEEALAEAAAALEAAAAEAAMAPAETTRRRRRAPAAAAVLFQAPTDVPAQAAATSPVEATPVEDGSVKAPSTKRVSTRTRNAKVVPVEADADEVAAEPAEDEQPTGSRRRRSRRSRDAEEVATDRAEPVFEAARQIEPEDAADDAESDADDVDGEDGAEGTRRRRRRRGGRRRRKPGDGSEDSADENDDESEDDAENQSDTDEQDDSEDDSEAGSSSRRRRRRRRRKGEDSGSAADDPDETVVRVREPRSKTISNEITAVEGSTRLEAKKQRRREGRAAGRRRAPIVTEAEFLARRESVERTMVIRARDDLTQIAVSEDNVLVEHYVTTAEQSSLIGNVYLGRVQNVLPSMEAAFIDIGKGRNAVLYAGEVDWSTLGAGNGPRKIESVLKSGQAVLVQVTKDPIGHKGARLTNQISLPGRYVVYVPRGGNGGISRKLPDTERNRLKGILKDIVPDEAGVIVRTAAEGATEEELTADVTRLQAFWEDIDKKSKSGQAPALLHGEPDLLIRVVRDLFTEDFTKLVISGDDAFDQVSEYVSSVAPHLADRVQKWSPSPNEQSDVFSNYRIDEQIKKALDRKVWLPSGGSLVIDRTEAMTVVDVNTGKFTGSGGNLEETVTKNNLEAAEEIVRQLRLRDIGGIIVIDFIDMVLELNRDLVLRRLVECLGRDRTKHQVAEVTSLGLVQMTRKRIGTGLLEAFSENCDHCGGRGLVLHDEPKESRRRADDGRSRGGQQNQGGQNQGGQSQGSQSQGSQNQGQNQGGQQSNGGQNGHDGEQKSGDGDGDGAKKSSRSRNRGRGRGRGEGSDEHTESTETPSNGDAAQRVAQIAAATLASGEKANGTDQHGTDEKVTGAEHQGNDQQASGDQQSSSGADSAERRDGGEAAQSEERAPGSQRSRRRRGGSGQAGTAVAEQDGAQSSQEPARGDSSGRGGEQVAAEQGNSAAEQGQDGAEQEKAEQTGSGRNGSTRRRRSSRGRGAASSNEGDAGNSGTDQPVSAQELASTPV
ncbi:Rne/Rng family ribonuclease [Kribbella qitaiheensis]|uniref:Ribonuclease E n=1 Tax=Kribbella qitaiheensis TaxID=1544730 RepID=A0A7G6X5V3_9ACTN|nr:Rne/Rng family ribonuclease [Kribbella qitaiheensis]QNE21618.1 Rne/Rng family ribonuclease [Kribbella qitaiheensis]